MRQADHDKLIQLARTQRRSVSRLASRVLSVFVSKQQP